MGDCLPFFRCAFSAPSNEMQMRTLRDLTNVELNSQQCEARNDAFNRLPPAFAFYLSLSLSLASISISLALHSILPFSTSLGLTLTHSSFVRGNFSLFSPSLSIPHPLHRFSTPSVFCRRLLLFDIHPCSPRSLISFTRTRTFSNFILSQFIIRESVLRENFDENKPRGALIRLDVFLANRLRSLFETTASETEPSAHSQCNFFLPFLARRTESLVPLFHPLRSLYAPLFSANDS